MDIEELANIYKEERKWISTRLSTIDNLLDRAAYRNASDEEDLTKEYDELEKRMEELSNVSDLIDKTKELIRLISLLEDNIDNLACFVGNEEKIHNLQAEIDELEAKVEEIRIEIAKRLKVDEKKLNNSNKR